jgi:16S rRNA (guanine966-N2)-methyltransferase
MQIRISSGIYKGRRINVPDTGLRPTGEKVRSAFFDTIYSMIKFENRAFLDLFSGTGAMCFEALSRGFEKVTAIENNGRSVAVIKENAQTIGVERKIKIVQKDVFSFDLTYPADFSYSSIYIDPPYNLIDRMPELLEKVTSSNMVDSICVIGIETGNSFDWSKEGWSTKIKKYGGTFLTFIYNWE